MAITFASNIKKPQQKQPTAGTIVQGTAPKTATKKVTTAAKKPAKATVAKTNVTTQQVKEQLIPLMPDIVAAKKQAVKAAKKSSEAKAALDALMSKADTIVKESGLDSKVAVKVEHSGAVLAFTKGKTVRTMAGTQLIFNALKKVDKDLPWKLATFKIGDVDKYLPKTVADGLITSEDTATRTSSVKLDE